MTRAPKLTVGVLSVAMFFTGGCSDGGTVPCNGRICPADRVCSDAHDLCVLRGQISACGGRADGQTCSFGDVAEAECKTGVCLEPRCGDGILTTAEACDDGNTFPGDGCNATCTSDESCGNGVVDLEVGEACDCGDGSAELPAACPSANSAEPTAFCSDACTLRSCGDGLVSPGEDCDGDVGAATCVDLGFDEGSLACSPLCRFDTSGCLGFCGDGTVDADEICDGSGPEGLTCRDFGAHFGAPGCTDTCAPDVDACGFYAFDQLTIPVPFRYLELVAARSGDLVIQEQANRDLYRYRDSAWELVGEGEFWNVTVRGQEIYATLPANDGDRVLRYFNGTAWTTVTTGLGAVTELCTTPSGVLAFSRNEVVELRGAIPVPVESLPVPPSGFWSCDVAGGKAYVSSDGTYMTQTEQGWRPYEVPDDTEWIDPLPSGELLAKTPEGLWQQDRRDGPWSFISLPRRSSDSAPVRIQSFAADRTGGIIVEGSIFDRWYFNGATWELVHRFHGSEPRLERVLPTNPRGDILGLVERNEQLSVAVVGRGLWTHVPGPADRVWRAGDRAVFARGSLVFRPGPLPGQSRVLATLPGRITGAWADNTGPLRAVDDAGNVATVANQGTGSVTLSSVPGASLTAVGRRFAVGLDGVVADAERGWARVDLPASEDLFDIASAPGGQALAVGAEGVLLHFDGRTWTKRHVEPGVTLFAAVAVGGDWIIAGDDGFLARFDGRDVQRFDSGTQASLKALSAVGVDSVFAVGDVGTALHFDGRRWSPFSLPQNVGVGPSDIAASERDAVLIYDGEAFRLNRPAF